MNSIYPTIEEFLLIENNEVIIILTKHNWLNQFPVPYFNETLRNFPNSTDLI